MVCGVRLAQIGPGGAESGAAAPLDPQERPMTSSTTLVRRLISGATLAAALALPLSLAQASSELVGTTVGTNADEIRASLTEQGYEVRKIKPEDGMMEAYALKGDKLYEVYVDTSTGTVAKVSEED
jgi:hypothetical protein